MVLECVRDRLLVTVIVLMASDQVTDLFRFIVRFPYYTVLVALQHQVSLLVLISRDLNASVSSTSARFHPLLPSITATIMYVATTLYHHTSSARPVFDPERESYRFSLLNLRSLSRWAHSGEIWVCMTYNSDRLVLSLPLL